MWINEKMKSILILHLCVIVCFVKCFQVCHLSSLKPARGLYFIAVMVVGSSALPAYFYEDKDEMDDINLRSEFTLKPSVHNVFKPTTTTEETIKDEWRIRGEYRLKCVGEVAVGPSKVVQLLKEGAWDDTDVDLKKWVLCVLNKLNLMSMEGVFRMDEAMSKLANKDKEDAESLINHCLPKKEFPPYEIAWLYAKCHYKAKGNYSAVSIF